MWNEAAARVIGGPLHTWAPARSAHAPATQSPPQTVGDATTLTPRMRIDLGATLGFAQWSVGATLLSVAAVDYSAYVFALYDLMFYERRLHPGPVGYAGDPRTPSFWLDLAGETTRSTPLFACAVIGLVAAVFAYRLARRRGAAALFVLSLGCVATIVGLAAHAAVSLRARALVFIFIERDPEDYLRWRWPDCIHDLAPWDELAAEQLAALLSALLLPAVLLAGFRVARHRKWSRTRTLLTAGVLGLPAVITAASLAHLWIYNWHSDYRRRPEFEAWVDAVQTTRSVLIGVAFVMVIAASLCRIRRADVPRLLPGAGLLALGAAAFLATGLHRRTIDDFYPLRDPGASADVFYWLPAPWTFDPPRAEACAWDHISVHEAAVRLDATGAVVLELDGVRAPFIGATTVEALRFTNRWSRRGPSRDLALLVDRRVPAAALAHFLAQLPEAEIDRVVVHGAFIHEKTWPEGHVELWTICNIGALDVVAFDAGAFAPETTWGDLIDGPTRSHWLKPTASL
jgi:hypothetical protein